MPIALTQRRRVASIHEADDGKVVTIAGWVESTVDKGGIAFVRLRDASGSIQVTVPKKRVPAEAVATLMGASRESVVVVEGAVQKSREKAGGFEVVPTAAELITEALTPLPLGVVDKVGADLPTRLDNRFMDIRKPEV
ncbi:MAG: OB-fold nucleic acid binding domain-containing protein, partial [Candidatus Rokuibacteriota bacterium]